MHHLFTNTKVEIKMKTTPDNDKKKTDAKGKNPKVGIACIIYLLAAGCCYSFISGSSSHSQNGQFNFIYIKIEHDLFSLSFKAASAGAMDDDNVPPFQPSFYKILTHLTPTFVINSLHSFLFTIFSL